jgi:hypothetical protein
MKKKQRKKYGLFPPSQITESDTQFLVHGLCGYVGFIYNKNTSQSTNPFCNHNDRSEATTGKFEIVEATNKSATSTQIVLHNTWLACYL